MTMKIFSRLHVRLLMAMAALMCAHSVQAVCVACTCTVTVTSIVFAPVNPLQTPNTDSSGNVRVGCGGAVSLAIAFTVALSPGGSNSSAARTMSSGGAKLGYNLYTDNTYATIWGDGTGSGVLVSGNVLLDLFGSSTPQNFTVYGRIPGRQTSVAPGAYSDSLIVTLTYF